MSVSHNLVVSQKIVDHFDSHEWMLDRLDRVGNDHRITQRAITVWTATDDCTVVIGLD